MDSRLMHQATTSTSTMTESSSSPTTTIINRRTMKHKQQRRRQQQQQQQPAPVVKQPNWLQKLHRSIGKKSRQALLQWFERKRNDLLEHLSKDASHDNNDKVTNLVQLLSLPLEITDLESCLNLGVTGALGEQCASKSKSTVAPTAILEDQVMDWNVTQLEDDAMFLAKLLDNHNNNNNIQGDKTAQVLLEALQPTARSSTRTMGTGPGPGLANPLGAGKTAQLTCLLLMIAQVLIGAQLLRRYRKRKHLQDSLVDQQAVVAARHPMSSSDSRLHVRASTRDPTTVRRASGSSMLLASARAAAAATATATTQDLHASLPSLVAPPPPSSSSQPKSPPPSTSPPRAVDTGSLPSLDKHFLGTAKNQQQQQKKRQQQNQHDHDDDRTAETDSLSLSEGVPQKLEDHHSSHSHETSPGSSSSTTAAAAAAYGCSGGLGNHQEKNVLAMLSFEGGTRDELDAGSNRTLPSTTNQTEVTTSTATTVAYNTTSTAIANANKSSSMPLSWMVQDQFALRMKKLQSDLNHVRTEQKTKIKDSTHQVQLRYQETNVHYSELTKRLEALSRSIQVKNSPSSTVAAGTFSSSSLSSWQTQSAAPVSTSRPLTPTKNVVRSPSPELVQAQEKVHANNEERARLLGQVATLQQDLQSQQDKHVQELQQKEGKLAELATRIQFLSHELERRVIYAKQVEAQLEQVKKQEVHVSMEHADLQALRQEHAQLSQALADVKHKFADKEAECQQLLEKLRKVPPPSAANTPAEYEASALEHSRFMKELEQQLEEQDKLNQRTFEMTQMLDSKRADIIQRTKHLDQMAQDLEERRIKVEEMEAAAAAAASQQQQQPQIPSSSESVSSSSTDASMTTEELEEQLHELQARFELQALECKKLNELLSNKAKLLQQKEKDCLHLTSRLEQLTAELQEKEARIEQLEQDVQDKQDLAAQNEAITTELQVQQELQEKMNQTTLQMIRLLEEKEQSNADLNQKLEALTIELNNSKKSLDNSSKRRF